MPKKKLPDVDGLGPKEVKKIRSALRLVWQRSHARKLAVRRATDKSGFERCEKCKRRTPRVKVDHIERVGDLDGGFIKRLFVPSRMLQCLCRACHNEKTKLERAIARIDALLK